MSDAAVFGLLTLCAFMFAVMLFACRQDRPRKEAEQKAQKLLTEWLSPAQLAQYARKGHFEVTGCHSGKRYRIRSERRINIDELDERNRTVAIWCFGPEGMLPIGDIMLAQKIALETNESASLTIANATAFAAQRTPEGLEPRDKGRFRRLSNPTGRNVSEA